MRRRMVPAAARAPERAGGSGPEHHGGHDVAHAHRPRPAIDGELLGRMAFRDDVPLRRPEAAPLVEPPQAGVDRGVRRFLQRQVERCLDGEALLVQLLRAVRALQVLAHLLDEIRRRRLGGRGLPLDDHRLLLRRVRVGLRDVADIRHPLQHVIAAARGARQIHVRALAFGQLHDAARSAPPLRA